VRVFRFQTGKLRRTYDESVAAANELQRGESELYNLEPIDFGRRMAGEKDLMADPEAPQPNAIFDESGNFIIYATLLGLKVFAELGGTNDLSFAATVPACLEGSPVSDEVTSHPVTWQLYCPSSSSSSVVIACYWFSIVDSIILNPPAACASAMLPHGVCNAVKQSSSAFRPYMSDVAM